MKDNTDYVSLRLQDFFAFARRDGFYLTRFLDGAQQQLVMQRKGDCSVFFFGGFEGAERKRALVIGEKAYVYMADDADSFELDLLFISFRDALRHKDLLGALMALGIKRELIGDILVRENCAYLFADQTVTPFLLQEFRQAGNCALNVKKMSIQDVIIPQEKFSLREISVSSMRLDCVVAALCNCARGDVPRMLAQDFVKVNHIVKNKADASVSVGDVLSIRHYGRFVLEQQSGISRKNRLYLTVKQFE